jgi:Protein of unknown function (DUF4019)
VPKQAHLLAIVLILLLLCACGDRGKPDKYDLAADEFHRRLDTESYVDIYSDSDRRLREVVVESKFERQMKLIHTKLGSVQNVEKTGRLVNYSTDGKFVTVSYRTTFSAGPARERFIWRVEDDHARLVEYIINSDLLREK